uniref:Uncharacterized protein n=1 Tax=Ascaris lumbricoides TaxID=6252 RepID=A0A0M3ICD5_ASCLU
MMEPNYVVVKRPQDLRTIPVFHFANSCFALRSAFLCITSAGCAGNSIKMQDMCCYISLVVCAAALQKVKRTALLVP